MNPRNDNADAAASRMPLDDPDRLRTQLRRSLTESVMPFWDRFGIDLEYGGILTGLDRQGRIIESDKSVWFQGRAAWVYSRLAMASHRGTSAHPDNEDRRRLETARSALDFLDRYGFDPELGRYRYRVTREGRPLVTRRYLFSDCFACAGHAAFAQAARAHGEEAEAQRSLEHARSIHERLLWYKAQPSALEPKMNPETRPTAGFAVPMILLNVTQELRAADPDNASSYSATIDELIEEMKLFLDNERRCVREQVAPDGTAQDHFEGRLLNPGHAVEGAWFILEEARHRDSAELTQLGTTMLDWMWDWGWDEQYGGLLYFRDAEGHDAGEYWHDMKFWWPQCEAIIATHYAYLLTGERRYAEQHGRVLDWTFAHLPDREYGEWFGYLHRDGSISSHNKGTLFKGPYHIPRMHLVSLKLLDAAAG
jgi:N-acylglucosamine 2-epimerase